MFTDGLDETRVVGDAIEKTPISMTITGGTNATLYALSAPNKVKYFWANDVTKNLRTVDRVEWKDGGEPKQLKTKKGIAALVNQWLTDSTVWIFEKDGHELIPNRYVWAQGDVSEPKLIWMDLQE